MVLLFPHEHVRDIQDQLVARISEAVEQRKSILAHAPTGLGKTAAALAPVLTYALKHNKTVFFLTSRHTQHQIALDTLKKIKERHDKDFIVTDIIGKKHMCLQPGVQNMRSGEFREYCKSLREEGTCSYYTNTYLNGGPKLGVRATHVFNRLMVKGTNACKDIIAESDVPQDGVCPYEISQQLAKEARVIITDYFYIFNPHIQGPFFKRINKELEQCIIIVDEAHNLPDRMRELMTTRLSKKMVDWAAKEAEKYKYSEIQHYLSKLRDVLDDLASRLTLQSHEQLVRKEEFFQAVSRIADYDAIIETMLDAAETIRLEQKRSFIATVAEFLDAWKGEDDSFVRYITRGDDNLTLSYRCLDPSLMTSPIIKQAHSVVMMSGTLTPTAMYRDMLGFPQDALVHEFPSPFPEENKLSMVVPKTSTKYSGRSDDQYRNIAHVTAEIGNLIKGNIALFFPSYYIRNQVARYFKTLYERTVFEEQPGMTSDEKHALIDRFKRYSESGAALLAVASGSYGEGIDLPGDLLKGVIVVGLPLTKPDLETKELIAYYDARFGKGWDYGYIFPAFSKTLQNAGRCIRTQDDKGVIIFLDERYAWNNYFRCFPPDMNVRVAHDYKAAIVDFFW